MAATTCPKCGATNPDGVQFCTQCHATLFFKCPRCEHVQARDGLCEQCGMNMDLFWTSYLAAKSSEQNRIDLDKMKAEAGWFLQILLLPLAAGQSVARFLFGQALAQAFSRLLSRFTSR
jgi:zinc-ribbon domain